MDQASREASKFKASISLYSFCSFIQNILVETGSTNTDMTTVFHARPDSRFEELSPEKKTLHGVTQGSNFLRGRGSF